MRLLLLWLTAILLTVSCKKSEKPKPELIPAKSILVFPKQDEVCLSGAIVSPTMSNVVFKWNRAENTESYTLTLKNLKNGVTSVSSTADTEMKVAVFRNTPYSWFVTSKTVGTLQTGISDIWKFYNSGPGAVAHAPYPAEAVSPLLAGLLTSVNGKVKIEWIAADVDNDILTYDFYLGTIPATTLYKGNLTEGFLQDIPVVINAVYYWKVITHDKEGNTSESSLYNFKSN